MNSVLRELIENAVIERKRADEPSAGLGPEYSEEWIKNMDFTIEYLRKKLDKCTMAKLFG